MKKDTSHWDIFSSHPTGNKWSMLAIQFKQQIKLCLKAEKWKAEERILCQRGRAGAGHGQGRHLWELVRGRCFISVIHERTQQGKIKNTKHLRNVQFLSWESGNRSNVSYHNDLHELGEVILNDEVHRAAISGGQCPNGPTLPSTQGPVLHLGARIHSIFLRLG